MGMVPSPQVAQQVPFDHTGTTLSDTNVQGAIASVDTEAAAASSAASSASSTASSASAAVSAHIAASPAHAASAISMSPSVAGGSDAQGAIAGVQSNLTAHTGAGTGAHAASAISVSPSVSGSSNVQGALQGLETTLTGVVAAVSALDTYANRPSPGTKGRLFTCTDSPTGQWIDNGVVWQPLVGGIPCTQPKAASNFTAQNAVAACTLVDRNGTIHLAKTSDSSAQVVRPWTESLSGTTAYVECCINYAHWQTLSNAFPKVGVCMRESSTGKVATFTQWFTTNTNPYYNWELERWTSNTVRGASVGTGSTWNGNGPKFMRLRRDSTTLYAEGSVDRQNWTLVSSVALTTAFTTAPDQVGICLVNWVATEVIEATYLHYTSGT